VPLEEARAIQLKAIKYAFTRQYTYNRFYHTYGEIRSITPDDLKTEDD
jgi:phenylacetate-coenzyme A ligase PaaK-like adenylate-forming protein